MQPPGPPADPEPRAAPSCVHLPEVPRHDEASHDPNVRELAEGDKGLIYKRVMAGRKAAKQTFAFPPISGQAKHTNGYDKHFSETNLFSTGSNYTVLGEELTRRWGMRSRWLGGRYDPVINLF